MEGGAGEQTESQWQAESSVDSFSVFLEALLESRDWRSSLELTSECLFSFLSSSVKEAEKFRTELH